jgi:hypothetical protein
MRSSILTRLCAWRALVALALKRVDEAVEVGDLALLRLERGLLRGQPGGAGALVVGIAAAGQGQALQIDGEDLADDGVEEIAVVRDEQQRGRRRLQPLLQPEDGVEVEVVGRLVEQQQVGAAGEGARQVEAHPPATGEFGHRAREIGVAEAKAVQHFGGAGLGRIAADLAVTGVQVADRLAVARASASASSRSMRRSSASPSRTKSMALSGRAGVSWATRAICQRGGSSTSPASACSSLASSANRLDLPLPLAPTTPTRHPAWS